MGGETACRGRKVGFKGCVLPPATLTELVGTAADSTPAGGTCRESLAISGRGEKRINELATIDSTLWERVIGGITAAFLRLIATGIKLGDLMGDPPVLARIAGEEAVSGRKEVLLLEVNNTGLEVLFGNLDLKKR